MNDNAMELKVNGKCKITFEFDDEDDVIRGILYAHVDELLDEMVELIDEYDLKNGDPEQVYTESKMIDLLEEINNLFGDDFEIIDFRKEV